jgi:hypothetical protein
MLFFHRFFINNWFLSSFSLAFFRIESPPDISDVVGLMQQNATVWPGGIITTFLLTHRRVVTDQSDWVLITAFHH